jgi:hypothetical protein
VKRVFGGELRKVKLPAGSRFADRETVEHRVA